MTGSSNFKISYSSFSVYQNFLLLELENKEVFAIRITNQIRLKNRHSNQQTITCRQNIIIVAVETYKVLFCRSSTTFLKDFLPVGTLSGLKFVAFILLNRSSIGLILYCSELIKEKYLHHKEQ